MPSACGTVCACKRIAALRRCALQGLQRRMAARRPREKTRFCVRSIAKQTTSPLAMSSNTSSSRAVSGSASSWAGPGGTTVCCGWIAAGKLTLKPCANALTTAASCVSVASTGNLPVGLSGTVSIGMTPSEVACNQSTGISAGSRCSTRAPNEASGSSATINSGAWLEGR